MCTRRLLRTSSRERWTISSDDVRCKQTDTKIFASKTLVLVLCTRRPLLVYGKNLSSQIALKGARGAMRKIRRGTGWVSALIALLIAAAGCDAQHVPSIKRVTRLEVPRDWVGGFDVHGNASATAESPTDVLEGTIALDGRFALLLQHEILPRLAPVYTTFTVSMAIYLTKDSAELDAGYPGGADQFRGIFWKGRGNDDRTPSAWLIPRTNRVTFRVSTTHAKEVWGSTKRSIPVRRWTHIAFTLGPDRLMKLYVDGYLDSAVETVGIPVANDGPMYVGKDMTQPGMVGFVHGMSMHSHALREEDVYQQSRWALRSVPDFDDEPAVEALLAAGEVALGIEDSARAEFIELMDSNNTSDDAEDDDAKNDDDAKVDAEKNASEAGVDSEKVGSQPSEPNAAAKKYAGDQYELAERIRGACLLLREDDGEAQRVARAGLAVARAAYLRSAVAGNSSARFILSTMYDAGYGSVDGRREPKRAHYHRLVAAAAGETGAQLAAGSELFTTAKGGGLRHARHPQAACPVALYYLFHAATRAYEENAKPGGQSRVERLKLFEGVSNQRGDHKGESDDRMMFLRQAAELGDSRAMLAMGNAHYWGNFGVPRDFERALRYYERAHNQGALLGTVGVAKMSLKGEGAPKNTTKAMDYYHAAANRSSPDALNGLGYLHFYGDEVERNLTTALSYFKRAAELGSGDGLVNAGLMLRGGMGCERNISEAYGYFARCAAMNHQSCQYNAAMIEAAGEPELGIPRDCDRAAARMRQVAEVGKWMSPMADGLKAHLAGEDATARWLYDHAAAMGVAQAKYNAAFLHEQRARSVRVGYDTIYGTIHGTAEDDDARGHGDESIDGWAAALRRERERERQTREAAAQVREHLSVVVGDDLALVRSGDSGDDPMRLSGALSAEMLRHYSTRIGFDPSADSIDLAWAALHRGDCAYFGPRRPGGCEVSDHRDALREYVEAGRAARAAIDAGKDAVDAGPLLARALYSEAWMRARGEGRDVRDVRRARRLLREGLAKGGWRSCLALAPPYVGLVLSDNLPFAAEAIDVLAAAFRGSREGGGSSSRTGSGAGFARRIMDAFGGGTWRAMHTIESAPDRIYPRWRLYSSAMYAFLVYTVGMMAGWYYVVRPSARFMFGLELAPLPFQVWAHGQRMLLRDGAWVPDLGYYGNLRERVRRNMIRDRVRARLREMDRAEAAEAASEASNAASPPPEEAASPEGEPRVPPPPRVDVARETPETLPPEEELGEDRSYSPFEPID